MKKTLVLFRLGHIYSFWSAGQYNVLELLQDYDVCLLVSKEYKEDIKFQKFVSNNNIKDVLYEPTLKKNNIKNCKKYYSVIFNYFLKKKPDIVIQNDYIEVQNMYIFCISKQLNNDRVHVVLSMSAPSSDWTFSLLYESRFRRIKSILRNSFLSKLVLNAVNKEKIAESLLHNYIIPVIIGIKRPYLVTSYYHNIDNIPRYVPFDYFFTNDKNEVGYLNKLLSHLTRNVIEVAPAQYSLNKHKSLPDNSSGMFFAPSLLLLGGINDDEEELWEKWVKCLRKIMEQESVENIGIKFHPSLKKNQPRELRIMKEYFQQKIPESVIYDESLSADALVKEYRIIVGDASTILLQARSLKDRKIISVDFNNIPGSGSMKKYSEINYFKEEKNISDLFECEIKVCKYKTNKKSLLNYLKLACK
mgnify:CR=1 FL=1|jgi:hypothetical protein